MNAVKFFIDRPIFAGVIWTLLLLVGIVAYFSIPVSQYPDIAPPTIQVTASYPGASAETIAETVAAPIEEEINGVDGMLYISSQSSAAGQTTITVTFKPGTDLDTAQVLVQNRVALAEPRLPEEARRLGISTIKANPDALLVVHMYSPDRSRDQLYISNYIRLQMRDRLQRLKGVGQIRAFGFREYSMRVWIAPERAASFGLTGADIVTALRGQNVEIAGGTLDAPPTDNQGAFQVNLEAQGRLKTPDEFGNVIVKQDTGGRLVRLKDVARVELGAQDYNTNAQLDENPAVALLFNQQPGSNALETADRVLTTVKEMSKDFPPGLAYDVIWNPTQFVAESVHEVEKTIYEAIILVSIVVFIFLQSVRASVIPIVAIPISLVGTFAVMQAFGFSLNNLSLFGLVLAIGIVVDDAIVVVENVERRIHEGLTPRDAAHATMDEVGGALIAIALVLSAVFIPTAFLEGISGEFYRQFAVTIATATVISAGVSLTLSPALAALLLKPRKAAEDRKAWERPLTWFFEKFDRGFDATSNGYSLLVRRLIRGSAMMLVVYGGLMLLAGFQFERAPKGFVPPTDQNYVIAVVQLPPGASLSRTQAVMNRVIRDGLANPQIEHAAAFAGLNGATFSTASNSAAIFFTMTDIGERVSSGHDVNEVLSELRETFGAYQDAMIMVVPPPPVRGIGNAGGFKGYVQDRQGIGYKALEKEAQSLAQAANDAPAATSAFTIFNTSTPKLHVDIDRVRAEQLGVAVPDVFRTLEVYLGSAYVNDFTAFGRPFRVNAQAEDIYRKTPEDIARLKVRNAEGGMVPLGSVATFSDTTGPDRVARYNLYPAAAVQGDTAPGYSTGQTLDAVETQAKETLDQGFGFEWTELALQQKLAGNTAIIAFSMAVVFVFLLLAAQYESLSLPLAVILIVPMSLLSAVTGVLMRGLDVNILVQVGFIVLIGLAAKNAILIVEFAKQAEDSGQPIAEAAMEAARLRLRPIVMTSFAFILGVVPLMLGTGAGYEMRQSLGTAVFFGMLGVTGFGLVFTPVFYVVARRAAARMRERFAGGQARESTSH
ncbi:HAE1 family hydrophobic/amphiphilic exporter-1 [Parvibaculum indicum]|uniref:efflux RND transporter permease subunit n=1 Tax=Parvibaculum indicum TaxID=562969 RepID=UPI00141F4538|nr:multidrug efflux RND transporter permease subunit [Parvibaculum indicum]NIJ40695.1 HAE1 family hydrophobic/amphiphilic exporter-1 [Parvibaculum indicum]